MRDNPKVMNLPAKPKLADVASAADVSLGTASNVFAHPERVRAEVRERVEAAARELGYHGPDPKGRLLREGRSTRSAWCRPPNWGSPTRCTTRSSATSCAESPRSATRRRQPRHQFGPRTAAVRTASVDGVILSRVEHLRDIEPRGGGASRSP